MPGRVTHLPHRRRDLVASDARQPLPSPAAGPHGGGCPQGAPHALPTADAWRPLRRRPAWQAVRVTGPLALLDSASLYFRSFFALPDSMRAADGTQVNAVRGFADTIARILTDRHPSRLVCCLD